MIKTEKYVRNDIIQKSQIISASLEAAVARLVFDEDSNILI